MVKRRPTATSLLIADMYLMEASAITGQLSVQEDPPSVTRSTHRQGNDFLAFLAILELGCKADTLFRVLKVYFNSMKSTYGLYSTAILLAKSKHQKVDIARTVIGQDL